LISLFNATILKKLELREIAAALKIQLYSCCSQEIFWSQSYDRDLHIYNVSALKIYHAKSSLVRFENKNILIYFEKRSSILPTTLAL
jgi:hypothetical protein